MITPNSAEESAITSQRRSRCHRYTRLASATTLVADGDYQQRLLVGSKDEIGQLEQQFNRMAEQLGESTARQQKLAEEKRLAAQSARKVSLHQRQAGAVKSNNIQLLFTFQKAFQLQGTGN